MLRRLCLTRWRTNAFSDNPLVTGRALHSSLRRAPITPEGFRLGSLCVVDRVPRQLSMEQIAVLRMLSTRL